MWRNTPERMKMVLARLTQLQASCSCRRSPPQYLLPHELHHIIQRFKRRFKDYFNPKWGQVKPGYAAVEAYLSSNTKLLGFEYKEVSDWISGWKTFGGFVLAKLSKCPQQRFSISQHHQFVFYNMLWMQAMQSGKEIVSSSTCYES